MAKLGKLCKQTLALSQYQHLSNSWGADMGLKPIREGKLVKTLGKLLLPSNKRSAT